MSSLIQEKSEIPNQHKKGVFLKRIPDTVYQKMLEVFAQKYHFQNGERMQIANYFVGISQELANIFIAFIEEITQGIIENKYPKMPIPDGFKLNPENTLSTEANGSFSFASFDMAVSEQGLENIEFQAVATYPVSAAVLNKILLEHLQEDNAYIFADNPKTTWRDFTKIYETIIGDEETEGIVITDRFLKQQKTNFEFHATQQELNIPIDIVDMEDIFEKDNTLFYRKNGKVQKINRLYNRILLAEALFQDNYPTDAEMWKFRFDKKYEAFKIINHPIKLYDISKRLSPYITHDFNPSCYELADVVNDFKSGKLKFEDYIWKHKWGGAGHGLILSPDLSVLEELSDDLEDYIAQKKVNFKIFKTDDGQEKIIELRFMTAFHNDEMNIVPMARLGHVTQSPEGIHKYKIHFGDNNKEGYGFSPVIIFRNS